jgi:tetratricopeptide (TPR) repeat protein
MRLFLLQGTRAQCNFYVMRPKLLIFCALFSLALPLGHSTRADTGNWNHFKELYEAGNFQQALEALRTQPENSAAYFYNLGNVYYRLGQYGNAVADFEKANRLKPRDSEIHGNLLMARSQLARTLGEDRLDPASSWLERVTDYAPMDEIRGALGLIVLLVSLYWLRIYSRSRSLKRTLSQPAGVAGLIAFALTACIYSAERLATSTTPAAVVERQIIRSGPGDQYQELTRVEPGMKLRALGPVNGDWRQVRYTQDAIGWIRSSSVLLL